MQPKENVRLKTLRLKYKLNQEELAEITGLNRATISKAEHGKSVSLYAAFALAYALGATVEYLFGHIFLPSSALKLSKSKREVC